MSGDYHAPDNGRGDCKDALTHGRCPFCERRLRLRDGLVPPHKDSRSVWCIQFPALPKEADRG